MTLLVADVLINSPLAAVEVSKTPMYVAGTEIPPFAANSITPVRAVPPDASSNFILVAVPTVRVYPSSLIL